MSSRSGQDRDLARMSAPISIGALVMWQNRKVVRDRPIVERFDRWVGKLNIALVALVVALVFVDVTCYAVFHILPLDRRGAAIPFSEMLKALGGAD